MLSKAILLIDSMAQDNYQDVTSLLQTLKTLPGYVPVPGNDDVQDTQYSAQQQGQHDATAQQSNYLPAPNPYSFDQRGNDASHQQAYAHGIPTAFDSAGYYSNAYQPPNIAPSFPIQQYYYPPQQQAQPIASPNPPAIVIPSQRPQSSPAATSKPKQPAINPRTIVTWPAALRHITSLAADPQFGPAVKKLITNQHNNEQQWWGSRLALIEKQKARVNGKRELNDVLKSLGGMTDRSSEAAVDNAAELRAYDKKVHRAATQMEKAMLADFVTMGVPFFGTEERLVVDDDLGEASEKGTITKKQLKVLQMKMIQHLDDMYNE